MAVPQDTDERLKHRPDSNQQRERFCAGVLSLDKRFSRIRLQHPRGGPDRGHDIEAVFQDCLLAFGAVSFVNGANDPADQRGRIKRKFKRDLTAALKYKPDLDVFAFFTNLDLTLKDREELTSLSRNGKPSIEIFHRERIREALDQPAGFACRHQYLDLPMSAAEQATFFAEFGATLERVIAENFIDVGRMLERIEFFADKASPLIWLQGILTLDRPYEPSEMAPFRVLLEFKRRGSRSVGPQFSVATEDTYWPERKGQQFGARVYVGPRPGS